MKIFWMTLKWTIFSCVELLRTNLRDLLLLTIVCSVYSERRSLSQVVGNLVFDTTKRQQAKFPTRSQTVCQWTQEIVSFSLQYQISVSPWKQEKNCFDSQFLWDRKPRVESSNIFPELERCKVGYEMEIAHDLLYAEQRTCLEILCKWNTTLPLSEKGGVVRMSISCNMYRALRRIRCCPRGAWSDNELF